jgi:hypothetical protein
MTLDNFLKWLLRLVFRLFLMAVGLAFFALLLGAASVMLLLWLLRAGWAKLTGQPVSPWAFSFNRRALWERAYRGGAPAGSRHAQSAQDNVVDVEVVDVQAKRMTSSEP